MKHKRHRIHAQRPIRSQWNRRVTATPLAQMAQLHEMIAAYSEPLASWVDRMNEARFHALYAPWLIAQQGE